LARVNGGARAIGAGGSAEAKRQDIDLLAAPDPPQLAHQVAIGRIRIAVVVFIRVFDLAVLGFDGVENARPVEERQAKDHCSKSGGGKPSAASSGLSLSPPWHAKQIVVSEDEQNRQKR
jgi:hypothetical protein